MRKILFLVGLLSLCGVIFFYDTSEQPTGSAINNIAKKIDSYQKINSAQKIKIAFMPDIHFHDIYAEFSDDSFKGVINSENGKQATIRTMDSQLNSTRLFNENYFALFAALDDVVARGIKLVALPGDFSDDGQPIHIRGLSAILERYTREHGIKFFATPGNHDPVRPFDSPGGKADFLGTEGKAQRIFSYGAEECVGYQNPWTTIPSTIKNSLPTICSEEVKHLGYQSIMTALSSAGFYPQADYLHWETPYSSTESYQFKRALQEAAYTQRHYEICHQGNGGIDKPDDFSQCHRVPDASYLVEPVEGVWLLAIDANVYIPKPEKLPLAQQFNGSGSAGYNKVLSHKAHVVMWIADVVKRAAANNKQLIAFSHFPMVEFYNGQSEAIAELFGDAALQLARKPESTVSKFLAETGLKVHVGGHMHFNDTGVIKSDNHFLFNIQAPSLAAYVPAYKILTLQGNHKIEVETIVLDQVPNFDELFTLYAQEHHYLSETDSADIWDKKILNSKNYREFTHWHLRELARKRFLPTDWPEDLRTLLLSLNGQELLVFTQLTEPLATVNKQTLENLKQSQGWAKALLSAEQLELNKKLLLSDFENWNGFDLAVDFYKLLNAGELALADIEPTRLAQYQLLAKHSTGSSTIIKNKLANAINERLHQLLTILFSLKNTLPNNHFMLNLQTGEITNLVEGNNDT